MYCLYMASKKPVKNVDIEEGRLYNYMAYVPVGIKTDREAEN